MLEDRACDLLLEPATLALARLGAHLIKGEKVEVEVEANDQAARRARDCRGH